MPPGERTETRGPGQHSPSCCRPPRYLTWLAVWFHCSWLAWAIIEFDLVEIPERGEIKLELKQKQFIF